MAWPLIAALARLTVAGAGGWLAYAWTQDLAAVFGALGLALAVFGSLVAAAVARGAWTAPTAAAVR
ncbi:MAG TPA: MATE family efflux transporter, partial [Burkholderiales bacterium]|nr:MATE family efflux transporter [Burkholderiales bacterium]